MRYDAIAASSWSALRCWLARMEQRRDIYRIATDGDLVERLVLATESLEQ